MKRTFLTLLAVVLINVFGFSQESSALKSENRIRDTKEELLVKSFKEAGLADEQVTKAISIVNESANEKRMLRKDRSFNEQEKAEKNKALTNKMKEDLRQLMGDSIYKKWEAIRKKQSKTDKQ